MFTAEAVSLFIRVWRAMYFNWLLTHNGSRSVQTVVKEKYPKIATDTGRVLAIRDGRNMLTTINSLSYVQSPGLITGPAVLSTR